MQDSTGWGHVPSAKLELGRSQRDGGGGNQGQIPVVYSPSLCQLLHKSEQITPAGISRDVDVMSVGMGSSLWCSL